MALGNNSGASKKFVTIVGGKWVVKVDEGTEGAVTRENKLGEIVHELQYSYVDGDIAGGRIKQGQFGSTVELELVDDGEAYNVQIPVPAIGQIGDYFMTFGKACRNIDPTKKLFLGLGFDKDRNHSFLYLKQEGQTVKSAFTKEDPNGLPPWEKKTAMGKTVWNADLQNEFLYGEIQDFFASLGSTEVPF